MRSMVACAAALMLLARTAGAEAPAERQWTGFYIGAGVGSGTLVQTQTVADFIGPLLSDTYGATGYFASVTAGYDQRLMPRVVAGAFVEFDLSRIANDRWTTLLPFDHERSWSIGGRVGYLATPTTLWYGLGGYTQSSVDFVLIGSKDLKGIFVGGGIESQLAGNWSLRGEYRYTHYQAEKLIDFCGCTWLEAETSSHTGRLMLVYRFGSGGWTP